MMIRNGRFLLFAVFLAGIAVADDTPSSHQLIEAAHKASDLSVTGPFELNATVVTNPGKTDSKTGRLRIYRDRDRVRVELKLGDETDTHLTLGEKSYLDVSRTMLTRTRLDGLEDLWNLARPAGGSLPIKYKDGHVQMEKVGELDAWCFTRTSTWANVSHNSRYCFDATRSVLLQTERESGKDLFLDFASSAGVIWPRRVELFKEGGLAVDVSQIEIVPRSDLPAEVFAVPEGATEFERCDKLVRPPALIYSPEPNIPLAAKHPDVTIIASVLVMKDGTVGAVEEPYDRNMVDQQIRETLKRWRFKPASCHDHPVNYWIGIQLPFGQR